MELRAGTIIEACRTRDSSGVETDSLIDMRVSFGALGIRRILCGLGRIVSPEYLMGRQCVFNYDCPPFPADDGDPYLGTILYAGEPSKIWLIEPVGIDPKVKLPDGARVG